MGEFFLVLCFWGYPLPTRYIGIRTLGRIPFQSLERKWLRGKVFILLSLRDVPLAVRAPGWALLLPPGVGPPFRPDQKVKLDKSEARRGAGCPTLRVLCDVWVCAPPEYFEVTYYSPRTDTLTGLTQSGE